MLVVVALTGQGVDYGTRVYFSCCVEWRFDEVTAFAVGWHQKLKIGAGDELCQNLNVFVAHSDRFVDEDDLSVDHVLSHRLFIGIRLVLAQNYHLVSVVHVCLHQSSLLQWTTIDDIDVFELGNRSPDLWVDLVSTPTLRVPHD